MLSVLPILVPECALERVGSPGQAFQEPRATDNANAGQERASQHRASQALLLLQR